MLLPIVEKFLDILIESLLENGYVLKKQNKTKQNKTKQNKTKQKKQQQQNKTKQNKKSIRKAFVG